LAAVNAPLLLPPPSERYGVTTSFDLMLLLCCSAVEGSTQPLNATLSVVPAGGVALDDHVQ